jgi:hypothetical protein
MSLTFNLSGCELDSSLTVGVSDEVYVRLNELTQRIGVPIGTVGELVATFDVDCERKWKLNHKEAA